MLARLMESLEPRQMMAAYQLASSTEAPNTLLNLMSSAPASAAVTREDLLDRVESLVRATKRYQDDSGAIIDPLAGREIQYSTPYYAYAVSILIANQRGTDLLGSAVDAMNHATASFAGGRDSIPDQHGEFFIFPLAEAYKHLGRLVSASTTSTWRTRLATPFHEVLTGYDWNWQTYAMKGAWSLYGAGIRNRGDVVGYIESSWKGSQAARLSGNSLNLYQDGTSTPDTLPYDAAARANLMFLLTAGYDGPSAAEMKRTLLSAAASSLYFSDPTGQAPSTGRSGNHVWNDVVSAVAFERAARVLSADGDPKMVGQYQRAASLAVTSADRWQRRDGLYQVTKNRYEASERRGYAEYSFLTNYNGYMMLHLAELATERKRIAPAAPAPAEAGGYAMETGPSFHTAVAAAGGTQVQAAMRGQNRSNYGQFWTQLGITRVSRAGWDSRLGAVSGQDARTGLAASLSPVLYEDARWKRLSEMPERYIAKFGATFVSSQLTRIVIAYSPRQGQAGPTFTQSLEITPDGILMTLVSTQKNVGVTLPLLVHDGAALETSVGSTIASTSYGARSGSSLSYILLDSRSTLTDLGYVVKGATGDLSPLLARRTGSTGISVYIYPRTADDPSPEDVQQTFRRRDNTSSSVLGTVNDTVYVGRHSAGGFGQSVDVNRDGVADLIFGEPTSFTLQLDATGRVTQVQTGIDTVVTVARRTLTTSAFHTTTLIRT